MTRNQDIRKEVLMQLYAARPLALSASLMQRQCKKAGLDYTRDEVLREAVFLCGQEMAADCTDTVSGETKFSITSKGVIEQERNEG